VFAYVNLYEQERAASVETALNQNTCCTYLLV